MSNTRNKVNKEDSKALTELEYITAISETLNSISEEQEKINCEVISKVEQKALYVVNKTDYS